MTDSEVNHFIATKLLCWGYSKSSNTYFFDIGIPIINADEFNPLVNEIQFKKLVEKIDIKCTFENLKDYVSSMTKEQVETIRNKTIASNRSYIFIDKNKNPTIIKLEDNHGSGNLGRS